MRLLSLAHLTCLRATPPEMIELAAGAGFDAVGLRLSPAQPAEVPYPMLGNSPMRRETMRRMRDTGIRVLDVEVIKLRSAFDVHALSPLLEASAELGARYLLVNAEDPDANRAVDNLAALAQAALPYRLEVGLEFMIYSCVKTLADATRAVCAVNHPGVFVTVDTLHFDRAGHRPADLLDVPASLLRYLQFCDAAPQRPAADSAGLEARTARLLPGEGALPLVAMLNELPADMPLSVEAPNDADSARIGFTQRARRAIEATRAVLAQHHAT